MVPLVVIGEPVTVNADGAVRATLVTVPPLDGDVLVIVKFGYVPLTEIPVPGDRATTWSGALLVTVSESVVSSVVSDIPVPATKFRMSLFPSATMVF